MKDLPIGVRISEGPVTSHSACRRQKRLLRLMNHKSLKDSVEFIEEISGEKMTPEEIEELRQLLDLEDNIDGKRH